MTTQQIVEKEKIKFIFTRASFFLNKYQQLTPFNLNYNAKVKEITQCMKGYNKEIFIEQ